MAKANTASTADAAGNHRRSGQRERSRHRGPAVLFAAASVTGLILAGCSSASSTPAAPAPATSATSADPSASLEAEKAKVIAAHQAYEQALMRLLAGGKPDPKIMEGTETPEGAREDARQAGVMFSTGDRMVGTLTSTPRSVQITDDTATMVTCVDSTKWVSVKAGTTPTPGQTGTARGLARVQFVRGTKDNWLVNDIAEAGKC